MERKLNKYACRYAVVRFVPFPETEEFVNIGVVVACPASGYFGFQLQQKRRSARVTNFFTDVAKSVYQEAIELVTLELSRIQYVVQSKSGSPEEVRRIFENLVHPREALIRFSAARARMAADPADIVPRLFQYYVERDFVTHEYTEQVMERRIRTLVHSLQLPKPFRALELGDELVSAHFPLVQKDDDVPLKAIKPFYLAQNDATKIIAHGGLWVDRMRRMRNRQLLPPAVLFAVEGPSLSEGSRYEAFNEICDDLRRLKIEVVPSNAENEIVSFAAG